MTPETRRNVLRYGIAIDLVILATGAGMLLPATPAALLFVFTAAVLLSVWKGGWQGGLTALLLSVVVMATMFEFTPLSLALFAGAAALAGAATVVALRSRVPQLQPAVVDMPAALPVAPPPDVDPAEAERATREEKRAAKKRLQADRERARMEQERAAAEQKREEAERERARLEAEREAAERARAEAEALAAKEREENERLAREREEAERERARLEAEREAAERARAEAEALAAKEREESERLAREREEAERARAEAEALAAKEREAAERARAEAEALAAKEREENERLAREREEAAREAARLEAEREAAAALAKAREDAERERARLEAEREAAERARVEAEARVAKEREESERLAREREEAGREAAAALAKQREEAERERARLEAEREAAERARAEAEALAAKEREELARERARLEAERRGVEEKMRQELDAERAAMRARLEQQFAAEREALAREAEARDADVRAAAAAKLVAAPAPPAPAPPAPAPAHHASAPSPVKHAPPAAPKPSILDTVTGWFKREPRSRVVNLKTKRINGNDTATRRAQQAAAPRRPAAAKVRNPRIVLLERRRATADTVLPKLRQRGVEVSVVERWIDAVDELLRVKPDALFLDVEHPDFDKAQRTTREKSHMPLILTGRSPSAAPPNVLYAAFVPRPYDVEELTRLAQIAMSRPDELLALQSIQRTPPAQPRASTPPVAPPSAGIKRTPPPAPSSMAAHAPHGAPAAAEPVVARKPSSNDEYEVQCFSCRIDFNAVDADWCSCLAKERTLVCTNCLSCFCKAPPAFKEKFWVEAPPKLFERKSAEARRQQGLLPPNPGVGEVTRPLVLTVEDDEDIQAIVQRVCANLGYGFVHAMNGQEGLDMAHEYRPNLILSDAFMPKLDGREMCRMLKEEPEFADTRMVVMTGLYTDTKYRSEAVKRFHIDDYIAKPVAITDLINLLQRHLEGVHGLPAPDDLHELHRRDVEEAEEEETSLEDVPLSDVLAPMDAPPMEIAARPAPAPKPDGYPVCCFNCQENFDATHAEWCRCVGRDNTLVCEHCGGCFCKAPAPYKERFWIDAPPSLFERKMIGSKRALSARANPPATDVKRPLILLVEDDENVQLIVRTVVTTMGYGFVVGANGQEGLSLAREYSPDLILSDAFMPKLDGREMCRLLKEDPMTSRSKAIIMTGLYTDRKYRNEALDYFKVDDYVAKPLAVDDLIKLFKKHLPQEVTTAH